MTQVREAMVHPVTSTDPVSRSSDSLESAGPTRKETQSTQEPVNSGTVHT